MDLATCRAELERPDRLLLEPDRREQIMERIAELEWVVAAGRRLCCFRVRTIGAGGQTAGRRYRCVRGRAINSATVAPEDTGDLRTDGEDVATHGVIRYVEPSRVLGRSCFIIICNLLMWHWIVGLF